MKVVALLSGGKDSCFTMMECVKFGHEIVCLANLRPPTNSKSVEIDSYMFQSVGFNVVSMIAECMELPLITQDINGKPLEQELQYNETKGDEVEDLYNLLFKVKQLYPDIEAVCCGAIFSTYQRIRVENVCNRLSLISLAFLWRQEQKQLLNDMIQSKLESILVKTAAIGLNPRKHLGKTIAVLEPYFHTLNEKYEFHICGEGGEYETLTLDCPLFKKRIVIDEAETIIHSDDMFAPVGYLHIQKCHLESKPDHLSQSIETNNLSKQFESINLKTSEKLFQVDSSPVNSLKFISNPVLVNKINDEYFIDEIYILESEKDSSIEKEMENIFHVLLNTLITHELTIEDVVYVNLYLSDMNDFKQINKIYCTYFKTNPASRSCIQVDLPFSRIKLDCYVIKGSGVTKLTNNESKLRDVLHVQSISKWAPTCIGPYSQANVVYNTLIALAGQIALCPETMKMIENDLHLQTSQTFLNIQRVLESLNSSLENVCGGVIYLNNSQLKNQLDDEKTDFQEFCEKQFKNISQSTSSNQVIDPSLLPILYVQVENLPRSALVEAAFFALTQSAKTYLEYVQDSNQFESETFLYNSKSFSIPRALGLYSCTVALNSKISEKKLCYFSVNLIEIFENLKIQISKFQKTKKFIEINQITIFYLSNWISETQILKAMIETNFLKEKNHKPPCVSFLSVINFYPKTQFLNFQIRFTNLQKAHTDLWIQKQI